MINREQFINEIAEVVNRNSMEKKPLILANRRQYKGLNL